MAGFYLFFALLLDDESNELVTAHATTGEQVFIYPQSFSFSPASYFCFHCPLPVPSSLTSSLFVLQEFATSGTSNTDTGKSGGHLETKYKLSDLGLTFNQKWNTDNTLTTEITMEDQVEPNVLRIYETI